MISYLKGTVKRILPASSEIIIATNGVGYRVGIVSNSINRWKVDDKVELLTHLVIRENAHELYGFTNYNELEVFELLVSISGIGPKMGMGVLSDATVDEIKKAIEVGNTELFTSVSGIGKKNAGRIILEMRSKLEMLDSLDIIEIDGPSDVKEALRSLGYNRKEINSALKGVDQTLTTEEQIREVLKHLGQS